MPRQPRDWSQCPNCAANQASSNALNDTLQRQHQTLTQLREAIDAIALLRWNPPTTPSVTTAFVRLFRLRDQR